MPRRKGYGPDADRALRVWVKLARAFQTMDRISARDIQRFGVTQPQFAVLECLGHLGPLAIGELSRKMLVTGGSMTVVIDNLEKRGLVTRGHSAKDRRSVVVRLTAKGAVFFDQVFPSHAEYIRQAAAVLDRNEQIQLEKLLKKLGLGLREKYK